MYIYYKEDLMLSRTILRCLEVVEVAHRGSTAGGRVVRLRVRLGTNLVPEVAVLRNINKNKTYP